MERDLEKMEICKESRSEEARKTQSQDYRETIIIIFPLINLVLARACEY
jgi:hypothetical protein